MTGALPETRLILLTWISNFSEKPVPANDAHIASVLNVTLKQFRNSIDYLVEEGYLLKVRNLDGGFPSRQRAIKFSYMLIPECFREWSRALDNIKNVHEFQYVFRSRLEEDSNQQFKKQKRLELSERLVLAMLIAHSSIDCYVNGFDENSISIMAGMSTGKLRSTIISLSQKGYISILSMGAPSGKLFSHLNPIYKVHPTHPEYKLINVGLGHLEAFPSIIFLSKLVKFYKRASTLKKSKGLPKYTGYLLTEHYLELAKDVKENDLVKPIHQLCHAVVFTMIPDYVAELIDADDTKDKEKCSKPSAESKIKKLVRAELIKRLFSTKSPVEVSDNEYIDSFKPGSDESIPFLRIYVLEFLSIELASIVIILSEQIKHLFKKNRSTFHVMGCIQNHEMTGLRKLPQDPILDDESKSQEAEKKEKLDNKGAESPALTPVLTELVRTDFILTLMVKNEDYFNDSLIFDGKIVPSQSITEISTNQIGKK